MNVLALAHQLTTDKDQIALLALVIVIFAQIILHALNVKVLFI